MKSAAEGEGEEDIGGALLKTADVSAHTTLVLDYNTNTVGHRIFAENNFVMAVAFYGVCLNSVPGWSQYAPDDLSSSVLNGGMSNELYLVSCVSTIDVTRASNPDKSVVHHSPETPLHVVLRVFGTNNFYDRKEESIISQTMAHEGIGEAIYYDSEKARISYFLHKEMYRQLTSADFRDAIVVTAVFEKLAVLHITGVADIAKEPLLDKCLSNWLTLALEAEVGIRKAATPSCPGSSRTDAQLLDEIDVKALAKEVEWLLAEVHKYNSPVCFCHNDLNPGNAMIYRGAGKSCPDDEKRADNEIVVFDFEYGGYNCRGFDLGNSMCESYFEFHSHYPGFTVHQSCFTSKEFRLKIWDAYLNVHEKKKKEEEKRKEMAADGFKDLATQKERERAKENLDDEAVFFMLSSHLQWTFWSIKMAANSPNEWFHYLEYGVARIKEYFKAKREREASKASQ